MEAKGIIHLEIKATKLHRYFGSPSAMYDNYTSQELGIARQSLLNYWQKTKEPYENAICIIRKGEVERKNKNIMKSIEELVKFLSKTKIDFGNKYNITQEQVHLYINRYAKDKGYDNISNISRDKYTEILLDAFKFIDDKEEEKVGDGKELLNTILAAIS